MRKRKSPPKITIDFGTDIGNKISCGAYRNYEKEELLGKRIIGIVNFTPMKMGPEISEVLVLGVEQDGKIIYLQP